MKNQKVKSKKEAKGQSNLCTKSQSHRGTKLKIEYIDIDKLKPWKKNPKKNNESVDSIVKSIEKFGYTNPVLVSRSDNVIRAGHTRVLALKKIGAAKVPVIYLDIDGTDAELYAIFDNKSTENTPWDIPLLTDLFVDFQKIDANLCLTGFSPDEIAKLTEPSQKGDSKHIITFEVTEKQREQIKAILAGCKGDTQTERLLAAIKTEKLIPQRLKAAKKKVLATESTEVAEK